jgi:hypothetical protein
MVVFPTVYKCESWRCFFPLNATLGTALKVTFSFLEAKRKTPSETSRVTPNFVFRMLFDIVYAGKKGFRY